MNMDKEEAHNRSLTRRRFLGRGTAGMLAIPFLSRCAQDSDKQDPGHTPGPGETGSKPQAEQEWRNRQSDMAYRQLGRTGLMVSEVVSGGDPVRLKNYRQIDVAIERGLNYLDMAPAYGRGECEESYARVIESPSRREKVFLTTKVSSFKGVRFDMYQEIFKGLTSAKQEAILKKANAMREERGVEKPGYFITYWPGQKKSNDPSFLCNAMMEDYGHLVEGSSKFREAMIQSVEGSLKRVGTDYFDILMCPHGANCAEEVQIPEIYSTFEALKKAGKVRFLGVSTHNDPAGVMKAAAEAGAYDVVMAAYNVINGGYMDDAIRMAHASGVGIIGMKVAMAVATHHESLQPIPEWRIQKVNRIVPGDDKPPVKAYLWALQNPRIAAVISNLWTEEIVAENLSVAGRKVELQPA
jgi:aryl-alcohol dehydrogenase-like predicted oxidoreductase